MEERIARLRALLEGKADCALITDDIDRRYLTGMKSSAGYVLVFEDEAVLIIDSRYIERAREVVRHCTVIEQENAVLGQLAAVMKAHGARTCAVQSMSLTLQRAAVLKRIQGIEFLTDSTLSDALYALRTVKSAAELERIEAAQQLAEDALAALLQELHAGMTERDARRLGMDCKTKLVTAFDHPAYYPDPVKLTIKLIYDTRTRKLLGANVCGKRNAVMRTDIFAVAIHNGMTTEEVGMVDLAYAPPFASVWDAVHIAANAAK